ncbi:MAG TPA: fumarylacetoacetate hydrolase family protein [Pseudolabrys sp.]|nr:fumarylacetoacetate hydrolase family protein [Pseudolabrys sp.]
MQTMSDVEINTIANEILAALGTGGAITPFTARPGGLTAEGASRVLARLHAAFLARGETIVGRKIGFTNRGIWAQYGVDAPNWGFVTDRTVCDLAARPVLPLATLSEPRIEPEIMFRFARVPAPGMDDAALLDCIDWLAAGYEIVQSLYPQWKFGVPDTAAQNAMHGALLIGPRHAVAARRADWLRELPRFTVDLARDGEVVDRGGGASVLEGPLSTLRYLMQRLADDPRHPSLAAGEIVSTGTLTKAFPVKPGETWTATFAGILLAPITLRFA